MKALFLPALLLLSILSVAQSSKEVKWDYSAKKIADKTYEIHMTATINGDYHMYAQNVGGDGPVPTSFSFSKNPLLITEGKVKEAGKMIKRFESAWNHNVSYYEGKVDFVQVVKLKANAKTSLSGKVEFMVCNEKQCLPPAEVPINVNVGG